MKCKWCGGSDKVRDRIEVGIRIDRFMVTSRPAWGICYPCRQYIIAGIDDLLDPANRPGAKEEQTSDLREACKNILQGPIDEPQIDLTGEYETGLFCGLEDNEAQGDGYAACRYGFEKGVERVLEWAQGIAQDAIDGMNAKQEPSDGGLD